MPLLCSDGEYWIEDLQSTNGTFLNGQRLPPGAPMPVKEGAAILLANGLPMPWPRGAVRDPLGAITIGRSPDSDVHIDLPIVSWNHARVLIEGNQYILEDLGSRNWTAIEVLDNRAILPPETCVYFGSYKIPGRQLLSGHKVEVGESAFQKVVFRGDEMIIGRDPDADVVLNYPMVSWRHARLKRVPDGILVEDLDSRNGTFVRGVRISGKVLATAGDEIGLGSCRFQILEGGELTQREYYGNLTIKAQNARTPIPCPVPTATSNSAAITAMSQN